MAEAKVKDHWGRTCALLALIANCHRDPKKTRLFKPADFDPFVLRPQTVKVDVTVLKDLFIDRRPVKQTNSPGMEARTQIEAP